MSQPITPKFHADTVVGQILGIQFNQLWDGSAWVLDINNIELRFSGHLSSTDAYAANADLKITAAELPSAGQSALQSLLQYLEQQMATKYS